MTRLFSYITYGLITVYFIASIMTVSIIFQLSGFSLLSGSSLLGIGILLSLACGLAGIAYWFYRHCKRVYLNGSSIYLYDLFSNKLEIIYKLQIVDIEFYMSKPYTYTITYTNSKNEIKSVYFIKSFSIYNMDDIITDLLGDGSSSPTGHN